MSAVNHDSSSTSTHPFLALEGEKEVEEEKTPANDESSDKPKKKKNIGEGCETPKHLQNEDPENRGAVKDGKSKTTPISIPSQKA